MAKVYGYWWGGHSYARSDGEEQYLEEWPSIYAAMQALRSRRDWGYSYQQEFNYADGRTEYDLCPVVGDESEISLYLYDPREGDNGPDRRVYFGPRSAVRQERL